MASESAIAESTGGVVTSNQIDYKQSLYSHPDYRYNVQYPNTFGQDISLSAASQTPVVIQIPPEVFNLSPTYLMYTVTLPASAAYTWYAQCMQEISHIQWYTGANSFICDIDNLQNYMDIILKKEMEAEEFLSLDRPLNGVGKSNSVVNVVPALRNSTMTTNNPANNPPYPSSVNYTEPAYFKVSANATAVVYNVQVPLGLIRNSAFSINKDIYLGQTSYLRLYFGPVSKVAYFYKQ